MRKLLTFFVLSVLALRVGGQNPNPQRSFSASVLVADPTVYIDYNDPSTNFLEHVSGLNFTGTVAAPTAGSLPTPTATSGNPRVLFVLPAFAVAENVSTISIQYLVAPTAGATVQVLVGNISGTSITIASEPTTITLAATTAVQTFSSFTPFAVTAGQLIGFAVASGATGAGYAPTLSSNLYAYTGSIPSIGTPETYTLQTNSAAFSASGTPTVSTSITPRQQGFDTALTNDYSAAFPYNGYAVAPNSTLGAIDWNTPWTLMVHIDRLNWNRTGTLVLASKGDISVNTDSHWELYAQMAGLYSQLCFVETGGASSPLGGICTSASFDALPNGLDYYVAITNSGTGATGFSGGLSNALTMYINGLTAGSALGSLPETNLVTNGTGFGNVAVVISGSGTGYANATQYTSTGGGTNCHVTGQMNASSGVPTTISGATSSLNSGCTSSPTINLTAPTGTGVTLTATPTGDSMNAASFPLLVPGYVSGNMYYGVAGNTGTQTSTYVDKFAIFPGVLSQTLIQGMFYQTKFYQGVLKTLPIPAPVLVFDDDGGGDLDNFFAFQMVIALHQHRIMSLAGVISEDESVTCEASWRQMLNQAGLNDIPLSVPASFTSSANSGTTLCTAANATAYDASTPQSNAAWESSTTMYRKIFAKYSTTPIDVVVGGPFTALAEFMASSADGISSLTGLELMAQNATNGGAIFAQGLGCTPTSYPVTTTCSGTFTGDNSLSDPASGQYVVAHNGTTPIYWIGGTPQSAGPGVLSTRTSNDPMYLLATHAGSDVRQCYDCLAVEAAVSSYFMGGVEVGYSGGTGYAASTPWTFSGGGANCQGSGIMTASSGVPNGIQFQWGTSAASSYTGIGSGCTSAPTVNLIGATGTGVTLTAYPTAVCGTYTITDTSGVWSGATTSATCSNHYFEPFSSYANQSPISGAPMSWFINSLVDPSPNPAPKFQ